MRNWRFNNIDFSLYPFYEGNDLGVFWAPERTTVRIWAPTAKVVEFRLYKDGASGEPFHKTQLQASGNGTWATTLQGDYEGKFYTLRINDGNWLEEIPDIYARCVGVNGLRGMIFDPGKTNPANWENDTYSALPCFTDAVIYEMHIRDFSIAENSGMLDKGRFLALTERNTQTAAGVSTGIDHLTELGITHVHLLPVNDFFAVDEEKPFERYNWGYNPLNFNAPEGSYSTNPYDGRKRIKELKMLVQELHANNIGVILDVVYNHTYFTKESVFNQTVPGYFYRQNTDGTFANASGCGNEMATERAMVRKYIIDSLKYWAEEYHIDGFRLDLMGIYDLETVKAIRKELDNTRQGILLYGEGWAADASPMPEQQRAVKVNIAQLPGIAAFNDDFRDALKGNHNNKKSKGFISGCGLHEEPVKFGIVGGSYHPQIVYDYVEPTKCAWAGEPVQCINYVSCHDNYTLWDKLKLSCPEAAVDDLKRMVKLAGALILTSQGVPFLHSGVEFCRTKDGNGNSYKAPDSINQLNWNRKQEFYDVFDYFRKLIILRKNHPAFRMSSSELIRKHLTFYTDYQIGVVAYCISGEAVNDSWKSVTALFNGNSHETSINLPEGQFKTVVTGAEINEDGIGDVVSGNITVEKYSTVILVRI